MKRTKRSGEMLYIWDDQGWRGEVPLEIRNTITGANLIFSRVESVELTEFILQCTQPLLPSTGVRR